MKTLKICRKVMEKSRQYDSCTVESDFCNSPFSVSCSQPIHTVKFDSNGGSAIDDQPVEDGKCANRPANPTRDGYTFDNWYSDSSLTVVYDFNTPVKSDFTLYAKWLQAYAITYVGPEGTVVDYAPSGTYTLKDNSLVSGTISSWPSGWSSGMFSGIASGSTAPETPGVTQSSYEKAGDIDIPTCPRSDEADVVIVDDSRFFFFERGK